MLSVSNYYIWSHFFMVLFNMADIVKVSHVEDDILQMAPFWNVVASMLFE